MKFLEVGRVGRRVGGGRSYREVGRFVEGFVGFRGDVGAVYSIFVFRSRLGVFFFFGVLVKGICYKVGSEVII